MPRRVVAYSGQEGTQVPRSSTRLCPQTQALPHQRREEHTRVWLTPGMEGPLRVLVEGGGGALDQGGCLLEIEVLEEAGGGEDGGASS